MSNGSEIDQDVFNTLTPEEQADIQADDTALRNWKR